MVGSCCSAKPVKESILDPAHNPVTFAVKESAHDIAEDNTAKAKTQLKPGVAVQSFNGRTYACVACKNGHRVRTCTHGYDKPIAPTKQPGRPSSGSKRKCTCPKDCACHDKDNCKCERNCVCVETMYLIVHVSKKDSPKVTKNTRTSSPLPSRTTVDGRSEYLQKVLTDRSGNVLTDEEIKRRQEEQAKREQREQHQKTESKSSRPTQSPPSLNSVNFPRVPSQVVASPSLSEYSLDASSSRSRSASVMFSTSTDFSASGHGGCQHPNNLAQGSVPYGSVTTQGCNCGATCQCIHCPEHANNAATRQYNHQQFAHMASHDYLPPGVQPDGIGAGRLFRPETPQASCMGGQTTFILSSQRPHRTDYSQLFPELKAGEYVMQYEVQRTPQLHQQYENGLNMPLDVDSNMQLDQVIGIDQTMNDVDMGQDFTLLDGMPGWAMGEGDVDQVPIPGMQPSTIYAQNTQYPSTILSHVEYPGQGQSIQFMPTDVNLFENINLPQFTTFSSPGNSSDVPLTRAHMQSPPMSSRDRFYGVGEEDFFQEFTTIEPSPFAGHPVSPIPKSSKMARLVS